MGDAIYSNVLMVGFAWQLGLVPLSAAALMRAIELNGVKVEENKRAFTLGRIAAVQPDAIDTMLDGPGSAAPESLDDLIERRRRFLVDYQDAALADRYAAFVNRVRQAESTAGGGDGLTRQAAISYFRLLAYKDEYEVARLHAKTPFTKELRAAFGADAKIRFHLAPPILNTERDPRGRPRKREFGAWVMPLFHVLASLRRLRGTPFDLFGYTAERRMERALIGEFEKTMESLLGSLDAGNLGDAAAIAALYQEIRGYGPVKEAAVDDVRARVATAMRAFAPGVARAA